MAGTATDAPVFLCEGWLGGLKAAMLAREEEPRMYDELVKTNQSLCEGKQPVFNKVEKGLITEPLCLPKAKRLDQASVLSISTSRWSRRDKLSKRKQPNYLPGTFQNLRNLSRTVAREVAGSKPRKARLTPPPTHTLTLTLTRAHTHRTFGEVTTTHSF